MQMFPRRICLSELAHGRYASNLTATQVFEIVCLWVYRGSGESCSPRKSRAPGNVADHIGLIRINCLPSRAHNGGRMTGYYV